MKKSAQVVMIPTNEKAKFGDLILTPTYPQKLLIFEHQKCTEVSQHLYFLSDEEIKEGDWFIMNSCIVRQCSLHKGDILDTIGGLHHESVCKKIIATTDRSLTIAATSSGRYVYHLPQPSQSFIEKFVKEYNKSNVITEVMVEYEWNKTGRKIRKLDVFDHILKINPDNTIDINMPKDSWSREEVVELIQKYSKECTGWSWFETDEKWIEENL